MGGGAGRFGAAGGPGRGLREARISAPQRRETSSRRLGGATARRAGAGPRELLRCALAERERGRARQNRVDRVRDERPRSDPEPMGPQRFRGRPASLEPGAGHPAREGVRTCDGRQGLRPRERGLLPSRALGPLRRPGPSSVRRFRLAEGAWRIVSAQVASALLSGPVLLASRRELWRRTGQRVSEDELARILAETVLRPDSLPDQRKGMA